MTLTTKFDTGQELWFIDEGKVYNLQVRLILISTFTGGRQEINYGFQMLSSVPCEIPEARCFLTREELLASL